MTWFESDQENPDVVTYGELLPEDRYVAALNSANNVLVSQTLYLHYFTARKTEPINQIASITGTNPAAATPTLCQLGVWAIDPNTENGLRVATIANDVTLWATTFTQYIRDFQSPWLKVAGQRYAVGALIVTAVAAPALIGPINLALSVVGSALLGLQPRMSGSITAQTSLPETFTNSQINNNRIQPLYRLIP